MATHTGRKEGDISSVFVSLSGAAPEPLPERFTDIKRQLIQGHESALTASWQRLIKRLAIENEEVATKGPSVIPSIAFSDLENPSNEFVDETRHRGVAVIRGVVPEDDARGFKTEVEEYVKLNPSTKAFPKHDPQVFELYWSPAQVKARAHPNMLEAQRALMRMWHSNDDNSLISTSEPLVYADRVRIRQPGDSSFALGPHVDGGSVERWEPNGYGLGHVYDKIFQGKWEEYDPWEASARIPAVSDLYQGAGACSMFRMFQGWLSLSHTAPCEGTLLVNPLVQLSTAYLLLRPFFEPTNMLSPSNTSQSGPNYLRPENWKLKAGSDMDSALQGANPGHAQELNDLLHPHLDLNRTMVHVPKINPGDYVVWHCDTIHAVDKTHEGKGDSSVMYIPVCPTTEANAEYLLRQRGAFEHGYPGPDFPGGLGESEHINRPTADYVSKHLNHAGLQSFGLSKLARMDWETRKGAENVIQKANHILGFS